MSDPADPIETTDDLFLGGKLVLRQPTRGHRAGHDAILLAAATHAAPGHKVIDLGAGVGAAGLALARRQAGLDLTLVEIDPVLASLGARNAEANGMAARIVVGDVTDKIALRSAGLADDAADRVLMNPPFHAHTRHRASPDPARRIAHRASATTLSAWVASAHRLLKPKGALTIIWRADDLPHLLSIVAGRFGSFALQAVHANADKPAIRVMVRAVKGGRAPTTICTPAILDGRDDRVEASLRGESTLALAQADLARR